MSAPQPIHEQFNQSFTMAGIQPSGGSVRNVSLQFKKQNPNSSTTKKKRLGGNPSYSKMAAEADYRKIIFDTASSLDIILDDLEEMDLESMLGQQGKRGKILRAIKLALAIRRQIKVTTINLSLWSTGTYLWISVQVPLAVLSLIGFGAAMTIEAVRSFIPDSMLTTIDYLTPNWVSYAGKTVVSLVSELSGITLSADVIMAFFFIPFLLVFALAMLWLLFIYLRYTLALFNPLSGKAAGLKMGMLLLAMVGYLFPILNLFPWYMFWTGAVWLRPK